MNTATTTAAHFQNRTHQILQQLKENGQLKLLQTIEGPMDATVKLRDYLSLIHI